MSFLLPNMLPKLRLYILYLFSEAPRKSDIRSYLQRICDEKGMKLNIIEINIIFNDIYDNAKWGEVAVKIKRKDYI